MSNPGQKFAETTINGHTYGLNTLPSTKSLECFGVVLDVIGPGASRLVDLLKGLGVETGELEGSGEEASALDADVDGEVLSAAVSALTSKLDARAVATIKTLLSGLRKDGQPVTFDHEFSGNFGALPELVAFALKHNYASFFGSALFAGLAGKMRGRLQLLSNPGSSGE
jgi:hypothetical protein